MSDFVITPKPAAHFGAGAIGRLPAVVRATGAAQVVVVTDAALAATPNAFGVVTDPAGRRKFYVGHASSMPAAAILDPALTVGLPPAVTAATGLDALTHALESYLSARPNPWSDGIALQVIRMIAASLPRAYADGGDLAARSQMLLARDTHADDQRNAAAAIGAVTELRDKVGLNQQIGEFGVTEADFGRIARRRGAGEHPRPPTGDDIRAILLACAGR